MLLAELTVSGTQGVSRFKRFLATALAAVGLCTGLAYAGLPLAGHWLVREDAIHQADAIVVLAGSFPGRVIEAAQLYRDGYASEVWLTRPLRQEGAGATNSVSEEDILNFKVLSAFGVPSDAIRILDAPIVNTADELNAIDDGLKENGDSSVIVVTNKAHTRRVSALWDRYHFASGRILLHAVSDDPFPPSHWWKSSGPREQAIHEFLGMVNFWAGMPVHRPLATTPPGISVFASSGSSASTSGSSGSD